jgi:hypothetical protein
MEKLNTSPDTSLWKQAIALPLPIVMILVILFYFRNKSRDRDGVKLNKEPVPKTD